MPYNELIKNFNIIRDYVRDFYVYGFDSREDYNRKSKRTYDDAKRRVESWLSDYMQYRQDADGKRVFISVDTRRTVHNPLFSVFKAKSFTDGDITLFFILFDILHDSSISLLFGEIVDIIDRDYLSYFKQPKTFDSSTIRKKLNEFVSFGMIKTEKCRKTLFYSRTESDIFFNTTALHFFSEVVPCGVIGSFLLDRIDGEKEILSFKHHYINSALDSEIVCSLFGAMHDKQEIEITKHTRKGNNHLLRVVPLKIFISVGSGRQYLMAYRRSTRRIISFRTDYIISVKPYRKADDFDILREKLTGMQQFMWGVSTQGSGGRKESVEFTVFFRNDERHIYHRLLREKRSGVVELLDEHHARFYTEVYDTNELITWIRSFICRITSVNFSNKDIETQFKADIETMNRIYDNMCDIEQITPQSVYVGSNSNISNCSFQQKSSANDMLIFNEIYGAYYNVVSHILSEAVKAPVSMERIRAISLQYAFSESVVPIESAIKNQSWKLILPDGSTPIKHKPQIPLTKLQLRFLKAITLDKRMKLFACDFQLPDDIEPLFTEADYCIFDRYTDGDNYEDEEYIKRFRLILSAIQKRQALDITLRNKKGNELFFTVMPDELEYSEKDDKFRLLTSGSRTASVINLGRITDCSVHEGEFKVEKAKKYINRRRTLTLEFFDERNALERVMLHFSHFEKTAEKLDNKRYRLIIRYEQNDETEILVRVLSFGPLVRVTAPDRFIEMIQNRLRRQKRFEL